jgi:predicted ATPase
VLEERFPETVASHPEVLAQHYESAGDIKKVVTYLQRAGAQAVQRSATEAINFLTTALRLVDTLPDTLERAQEELALQLTLGPILMATSGFSVPEVKAVYTRARELCHKLENTQQLFSVLRGLFWTSIVPGDIHAAHELAQQQLHLAEEAKDRALFAEAHSVAGLSSFLLGDFEAARAYLEAGIAYYDAGHHQAKTFFYLTDSGVLCLSYGAFTLWYLGYPDLALQRCHQMQTLARKLSHPHSLAHAFIFLALTSHLRRENTLVQEHLATTLTLSAEQGFPHWLGVGGVLQGWILAQQGHLEEGIRRTHQGLALLQDAQVKIWNSWCLGLQGENCRLAGQIDQGLAQLDQAFAVVHETEESAWKAELHRLKGELLLRQDNSNVAAQSCFQRAIEIAREQNAKSLELRSTMSLARLLASQDRRDEARAILAEIYNWFTEGFDTADLKDAKALLDELAT